MFTIFWPEAIDAVGRVFWPPHRRRGFFFFGGWVFWLVLGLFVAMWYMWKLLAYLVICAAISIAQGAVCAVQLVIPPLRHNRRNLPATGGSVLVDPDTGEVIPETLPLPSPPRGLKALYEPQPATPWWSITVPRPRRD